MLIKVFNSWIEPTGCRIYSTTFDGEKGVMIVGAGNWSVFVNDHTCEEVAAEINKQIKGGK